MATEEKSAQDEILILTSSIESKGELFRFEYIAHQTTSPPENHVHHDQEERLEVLAGTVSCRVNDQDVILEPGDTLTFPIGVPHAVWNADANGSRTIGEFRPALRTQALFEAVLPTSSKRTQH